MPDWVWGALVWNGMAALMILGGVAWWLGWVPRGHDRKARWYHQVYTNPDHPFRGKYAAASVGAMGLALLVMSVAFVGVAAAGLIALVLFVLSVVYYFRPPNWSKPAWLREEERRAVEGLPPEHAVPPEGRTPTASRAEWVIAWAIIGLSVLGVALWNWPPGMLVGAGIAMSVMAVTRVRR